jgi:hypothetical protein
MCNKGFQSIQYKHPQPKNDNDSSERNMNLSDTYKDYNTGNPKTNSNVYPQLSDKEEEESENQRKYLSIPSNPKNQTYDKIMHTQTVTKRFVYKNYNTPSIMEKKHTTQKCLPSSHWQQISARVSLTQNHPP